MSETMNIANHKQAVMDLLREGEALLRRIDNPEYAEQVRIVMVQAEQKKTPTIMFYGLYNAGKSTLINALCRKDVAPTGDYPKTTKIQTVPWEGYTLIDTPGINAHAEHTETAEKAIHQSDVILFVMDNADTFDNAMVYQAIVDILKMGKPIALIINQKNVSEDEDPNIAVPNQESVKKIVGKVSTNLEIQANRNGMQIVGSQNNFLGIFPVNALTACAAAGVEPLHTASGLPSLCNAINSSIRRSEEVYMLRTPLGNLRDILRDAIKDYQDASIYGEKQALAENRKAMLTSRQRLRDRLMADGLRKIEAALEQVKSAAANGQPVEDISQKLSDELNALLREAAEQEQMALRSALDLEAMPGYQPEVEDVFANTEKVLGNSSAWFLGSGLALGKAIVAPTTIPTDVLIALITGIAGAIQEWIKGKHSRDQEAQKAAAESQERLANYYRWLNELHDQEVKIKADYEKAVNDFLVQSYDSKLAEIDTALADVDNGCAEHTKNLRELEQLQMRIADELVALSI